MKRLLREVRRYVRSAPLTYAWLVVLLATTVVQHSLSDRLLRSLLQSTSTNLHHLASDPVRVLINSLLWIDGRYWWPYLVIFTVFLAPAERWLGHLRWLVVGLVCHVCATYLSEGFLYWTIQEARGLPSADRCPRRRRELFRRRYRRSAVLPDSPALALALSGLAAPRRRMRSRPSTEFHRLRAPLRARCSGWPATR